MPIDCEFDKDGQPSELIVAEIKSHETFGELSIVGNLDRQFNAHATEGSRLLYIEKDRFRRLTQDFDNRVYQAQIENLRKISCLKGLSFRKLKSFVD